MLTIHDITNPSLLLEKDGTITLFRGSFHELATLHELDHLHQRLSRAVAFVLPFSAARENGMEVRGDDPLLAIQVHDERVIVRSDIEKLAKSADVVLASPIQPTMSDAEFAANVQQIQDEDIAGGNASQVVFSRTFEGIIKNASPRTALAIFNRLLDQRGQYVTFLFSDGRGHAFVGASPERHLEVRAGEVYKNPIAGTMPKADPRTIRPRLQRFLRDAKEINELSQVLDEELKIMSVICPDGGKVLGPFLRETGSVIHTEYRFVGRSHQSSIAALRASLHAPTLVGSPLASAFRILARRESRSRRYYGGEIGVLQPNGDVDSAIMIRAAEVFPDGRIVLQAGAGIVRDSEPLKEARETSAKAKGLVDAISGRAASSPPLLTPYILRDMQPILDERNLHFSSFHIQDQMHRGRTRRQKQNAQRATITIVNNEDNFANMIAHMTRHMGYRTRVVDTFAFTREGDASEIIILGPGPGNINDAANPRMVRLLSIARELLDARVPVLGVCLGLQAIAKTLGIPVVKQDVPTQGMQKTITLFGKRENVAFYNSFSPVREHVPAGIEMSTDEQGRILAMRSAQMIGFQFHVESAMTQHGYAILEDALKRLSSCARPRRANAMQRFVQDAIAGDVTVEEQVQFLQELNARGFTGGDIAALVRALRAHVPFDLDLPGALDVCGTGGSGLSRINTSTITAFVLAGCGVRVAKHGNKAASGRFGSFDLLESLGINILASPRELESLYKNFGLAFIYARSAHPIFAHFAEARLLIAEKTILNLLGPLLNPARPPAQIIGTSSTRASELLADAAEELGMRNVVFVHGADGLDELTLTSETYACRVKDGKRQSFVLTPELFGCARVSFKDIAGGDAEFNTRIAEEILDNRCRTAHRELVLANAALALTVAGRASSYGEAMAMARHAITSGRTRDLLEQYRNARREPDVLLDIANDKRQEVEARKNIFFRRRHTRNLTPSDRDFCGSISRGASLHLIAEIKKASPSAGSIDRTGRSIEEIAVQYERLGSSAISVVTDEKRFRGSRDYLQRARQATQSTPLLMKDFIVDEFQIEEARVSGADAILLMASLLTDEQIRLFTRSAKALNMDVLVEVHTLRELERAIACNADIIGINNRNLHDLSVDARTFFTLFPHVPASTILVAESGYSHLNTPLLQGMANAVLVGTALMQTREDAAEILKITAPKKVFKACGIRTVESAKQCVRKGADLLGLNFVPHRRRCVTSEQAREIRRAVPTTPLVGVFEDQSPEDVNRIAADAGLDFVQLAGEETPDDCRRIRFPIIKTIRRTALTSIHAYETIACMFIVDGPHPGSGASYDYSQLKNIATRKPFLVAGGVSEDTIRAILAALPDARGIDVATGIETGGTVDARKVHDLALHLLRI